MKKLKKFLAWLIYVPSKNEPICSVCHCRGLYHYLGVHDPETA